MESKNEGVEMKPQEKMLFLTAQNQASLNKKFVSNLESFIRTNQVDKVYIFAVKGKNVMDNKPVLKKQKNWDTGKFELVVINEGHYGLHKDVLALETDGIAGATVEIIYETRKNGVVINDNLAYFHTQMLPQVVDPYRGLTPKLPRDKSYIVNATKVRMEVIGTTNSKSPRIIASSGALTKPRYNTHMQTGVKATEMHTYGFTYVEIFNSKRFHTQPIIANQSGGFSFRDKKYVNGEVKKSKYLALVVGDIHLSVLDKRAWLETRKQIREHKPKYVVFHDLFDGASINHHEEKKSTTKAKKSKERTGILEEELKDTYNFIKRVARDFPKTKFLVVESNHDEFIRTYIDNDTYNKDFDNRVIASRLFIDIVDDTKQTPVLELALRYMGKFPRNVKFLHHDEEFRVGGKLVSLHGHKGLSGARGNPRTFERNNVKAVTGHTHSPKLYSNGAVVGHITDVSKQDYARGGLNNWLQANILIDDLQKFHMLILESNFK